ncbi:MAG: M23 family metallopeptidase [Proteobacteria bacterium]|nr:M23 family metallopeptidase [Pseudomonadota bacterium]
MNVVIFGNGFGRAIQVNLAGRTAIAMGAFFATTLCAAAFLGGFWFSAQTGSGVRIEKIRQLTTELDAERLAIAATRQHTEDTLDALAIRIGQMNARVIRLDALGRRLIDMADIADGEFDFDAAPAMGGPEEPELAAGSAAVPEVVALMANLGGQLDSHEAQLAVLEGVLMNKSLSERVYPKGRPVKSGWMSSYFGRRTDPFTGKSANHRGIDFAGKQGAEIIAVADGVVTWSAARYGYGEMVEITHGNGYATRYAHNSENLVRVGEEVRKGQVVALMGETGRATGPNLHFEVLLRGQQINPVKFVRQAE